VLPGNLLTLPTDKGLLYVEPLYLQGVSSSSYPQLGQVLVWYNNSVGMGPNLKAALQNASPADLGDVGTGGTTAPLPSPGATTTEGGQVTTAPPSSSESSVPPTVPADAGQALADLQQAEQALSDAKTSGDLGRIGTATQRLYDAVQQYLELAGPTTAGG
jgi:uncharacterized membrane protein (UPF0182 family)